MSTLVENAIEITRIFDAPRELVWKAWTEPEHFKRWWGPKDFTCPFCEIDFRIGGKYLNCMRSPEGKDFWTTGAYLEIKPPERIVYTDSFADDKGNVVPASYYGFPSNYSVMESIVTLTFEIYEDKTKMTLKHTGIPSGQFSNDTKLGWDEIFDKLAESLK
ncbi:MAG: SRPBCC domain-containing protein [Ignavibacteriaceae bacterium]